jgi:hypothetical protein
VLHDFYARPWRPWLGRHGLNWYDRQDHDVSS